MKNCYLLAALVTILLADPLSAQNIEQDFTSVGKIDWTVRKLYAVGVANEPEGTDLSTRRAAAIEQAKTDAFDKLMRLIGQIKIHGVLSGFDRLRDRTTRERAATVAKRFTVVEVRQLPPNAINVKIEFDLAGTLSDILLPHVQREVEPVVSTEPLCPLCGRPWPKDKPVPEESVLVAPQDEDGPPSLTFSGLLIDARGLNLVPALAPRIVDQDTNEVYDLSYVKRNYAVEIGLVEYARDEAVDELLRLGDNPYKTKAIGITGDYQTDLVIANGDARIIHGAAANKNFLKRCRVVILMD